MEFGRKPDKNHGKSPSLVGKSTISMGHVQHVQVRELLNYQRVKRMIHWFGFFPGVTRTGKPVNLHGFTRVVDAIKKGTPSGTLRYPFPWLTVSWWNASIFFHKTSMSVRVQSLTNGGFMMV